MNVHDAVFEWLDDPPDPGWVMRVTIHGEDLIQMALPIIADVGDQRVLAIMPTLDPDVIQGFLAAEPSPGDELFVGLLDLPLLPTGISYQPGSAVTS